MKILATCSLPLPIIQQLEQHFSVTVKPKLPAAELLTLIPEFNILIVRSDTQVNKTILKAAKNLKIIGRIGMGLDNIDIQTATEKGIQVLNTLGGNSQAVAELTMGMILALSRNIALADHGLKKGQWLKSTLVGHELHGKTIGIIGLGNIGKIVARLAQAFGMEVIGFDPFLPLPKFKELNITPAPRLKDLLKQADIVSLHLPKTPATTNLLDEKELKLMKKTALLINGARGGIVNETALLNALKKGELAGAGIDTWEQEPQGNHPLQKLPNVLALPHLGASTHEAQEKCIKDLIQQILQIITPPKLQTF